MYKRNDGTDTVNAIQNQFTAYVSRAVRNKKIQYINRHSKYKQIEITVDMQEYFLFVNDVDETETIDERDELQSALRVITARERYVFLSRVLDEKDFAIIANELGIGYKGAAAIYYRTIEKLKKVLGGMNNEF